jgi:hypothetical protein
MHCYYFDSEASPCAINSSSDSLKTSSRLHQITLIQHLNTLIFWSLSADHFFFQIYNVQKLEITRITTFRNLYVVYQVESRLDPSGFLIFYVLERTLYKSNYMLFILSWCRTHTKIRSELVDTVTTGSQKITLWGPQRTPICILKVKFDL